MAQDISASTPVGRILALSPPRERAGRGWLVRCPAHADGTASLKVEQGSDGRALLDCKAGCSFADIVSAFGLEQKDMFVERDEPTSTRSAPEPLTLAEFAAVKQLNEEQLRLLGVSDGDWHGRRCVDFAYRLLDGREGRARARLKGGFRWHGEGPLAAYTPDRCALARAEGYAVLVEGESDTLTLHLSGIPAIGFPGADTVERVLRAEHLGGLKCLFVVEEPDRGGKTFLAGAKAALAELGSQLPLHVLRMPDAAKDPSALYCRDPGAFAARFHQLLTEATKPQVHPGFQLLGAEVIFAELPPVEWKVKGLQIGAGRPGMIAGYGASAKTLSAQALALAVATGSPAWGHFETRRGEVRHLDYEQGFRATARRYQRLLLGHGLEAGEVGERLKLAVFPTVYLDSPDAVDAYSSICDGVDLVVLDALRGATPTMDENDSAIRKCIDNLTRVSEKTGTAFVVIHHAGKPNDGHAADARTVLRGSSAIFDACGSVFVVAVGKSSSDPRKVTQVKPPAEAEGAVIEPFSLVVEDVTKDMNPTAGVRVVYGALEARNETQQASERYAADAMKLLDFVRANPGASQNVILTNVGMGHSRAHRMLSALTDERKLKATLGPKKATHYWLEGP